MFKALGVIESFEMGIGEAKRVLEENIHQAQNAN